MKKFAAIFMTFALLFSFASCGAVKNEEETEEGNKSDEKSTTISDTADTNNCVSDEDHEMKYVNFGKALYYGEYPKELIRVDSVTDLLDEELDESSWSEYSPNSVNSDIYFADVVLSGHKYRAVKNGEDGETEWFEYKPLEWMIVDETEGLVICNDVIDYRPYADGEELILTNYSYDDGSNATDWYKSYIDNWLSNEFYSTAFFTLPDEENVVDINSLKLPSADFMQTLSEKTDCMGAQPTAYADAIGAKYDVENNGFTDYMLMNTEGNNTISYCTSDCSIVSDDTGNIITPYGIRPIMEITDHSVFEGATLTVEQLDDAYIYFSLTFVEGNYDCTSDDALNYAWEAIIWNYDLFGKDFEYGRKAIDIEYIKDYSSDDEGTDPLGRFSDSECILSFDAEETDNILKNNFCVEPDHNIDKENVYYKDGFYYVDPYDGGGGPYGGYISDYHMNDDGTYTVYIYDESADTFYDYSLSLIEGSEFSTWALHSVKVTENYEASWYNF